MKLCFFFLSKRVLWVNPHHFFFQFKNNGTRFFRNLRFLEQPNPSFEIVSAPKWQSIKVVSRHVEDHFKIFVVQVLFQVTPIHIGRHFEIRRQKQV